MRTQAAVPNDSPLMIAWNAYKATPEYENTKQWATAPAHTDGSLWAAFMAGFQARALEQPEGREAVAAGEPSAAAMAQAFIERYESRYTPHTVELVMAEVRARARELDTTPPAKPFRWDDEGEAPSAWGSK